MKRLPKPPSTSSQMRVHVPLALSATRFLLLLVLLGCTRVVVDAFVPPPLPSASNSAAQLHVPGRRCLSCVQHAHMHMHMHMHLRMQAPARSRGSRRSGRSSSVPSARPRPWWTLRSPFRRRPVLTGRWGPPNAPKPSFLHSMMTHVGWCSGFGLSEHPYGCLGLVVKDLGPLEHFLKKPFFGPPIFYLFSAKSCHRPRPMPGFDC